MSKTGQSWTQQEEQKLTSVVKKLACAKCFSHFVADCECGRFRSNKTWQLVAKELPGRTAGACQGRWNSKLDPKLDTSPWTEQLDARLLELYKDPKYDGWSKRARALSKPGLRRSGAEVASRYFFLLRSRQSTKKLPVPSILPRRSSTSSSTANNKRGRTVTGAASEEGVETLRRSTRTRRSPKRLKI